MSSLFFTAEERNFFEMVLDKGLHDRRGHYWWVVRFAIAQSLRLELPVDDRYGVPAGRDRSELELEQITGLGKEVQDYDDALRLMLSVRHQEDLFVDTRRYVELLQKHARRGIDFMRGAWQPGRNFHDYLLNELYTGIGDSVSQMDAGASLIDFEIVNQGLNQIGVSAAPAKDPQQGPRLTRFTLTLSGVEDYDRLRKGLDDLAFAIGLGNAGIGLAREQGERRVVLDIPRPGATWHDVTWSSIQSALHDRHELMPVCPGVDVLGRPLIFDLAEAPHLFVAGATGSGKSVCLNALLLSLLVSRRPPELLMIDPKGVDFTDYNGCNRLRGRQVITDMADAVRALREVVQEMEERQSVLRQHNARSIAEAQANGAHLERLIVVVDELADFMMGKSGAEEPLIRLAQKARATGIHLLLATQRPEAATFPGLLRANIPSRIALTVQKSADSRIILDESGAENLLMRGDMLVKLAGREAQRAHGARVESADIRAAVAAVNRK
ncbi:FtsK/SpoIIIE domain-containing protein [Burkholderia ubonensis]|uniref:FtsK/SpoIIIE domain-containing protein n=1 Tax=Burkholderia ubonensis TaxID=101571 RepID=UPI0008FE00F6|nr:FtsK/SpoIIIE domain-containing protein [Burkholderia ubonensis]